MEENTENGFMATVVGGLAQGVGAALGQQVAQVVAPRWTTDQAANRAYNPMYAPTFVSSAAPPSVFGYGNAQPGATVAGLSPMLLALLGLGVVAVFALK